MLKCSARLNSTVRLLFFVLVSIAGVLGFNMASRLRSFDVQPETNCSVYLTDLVDMVFEEALDFSRLQRSADGMATRRASRDRDI
jgi:hypothetical protein